MQRTLNNGGWHSFLLSSTMEGNNHYRDNRKKKNVLDKMAAIKEMYAGKKIIIGRDKLDHVKGVQHKLNAFQKFLTMFPEWQNKVRA